MKEFVIGKNDAGQRLDRWLAKTLPVLPAPLAQKYIRLKRVKVNGKGSNRDVRLNLGDVIQLYINDEFFEEAVPKDDVFLSLKPDLNIVYEDENIMLVDKKLEGDLSKYSLEGKEIPDGVMIFRIFGALMFGAADKLESILTSMGERPKVAILRMRTVLAMDSTALDVLDKLYEKLKSRGVVLMITGAHSQPLHMMEKSGFLKKMGEEFVLSDIDTALQKSREILEQANNNLPEEKEQ